MAPAVTARQRAVLARLVQQRVLTQEQADAVLSGLVEAAAEERPRTGRRGAVFEVLAYVGAALVLAAAVTIFALTWDSLTRPGQVSILVVIAVVLVLAAFAFAALPRSASSGAAAGGGRTWPPAMLSPAALSGFRRRIVATLLAFAAVAVAAAVGTARSDHVGEIDWSGTGFLAALLGYSLVPAAPGLVVTGLFSAFLAGSLADLAGGTWPGANGVALLVVGVAWAVAAVSGLVTHRALALAIGLTIGIVGAQAMFAVSDPWGYGLTFGIAVVCFAGFLAGREQVLLAGGVVGLTLAVPEALWHLTEGALGGPVVVLIAGAVLLASAALGVGWERSRARHESGVAGASNGTGSSRSE